LNAIFESPLNLSISLDILKLFKNFIHTHLAKNSHEITSPDKFLTIMK